MVPLISVRDLRIGFKLLNQVNEVVKGISFEVFPARTLAIVGESGSGKSVSAQAIMGILPANAQILGGEILFNEDGDKPVDLSRLRPDSSEFRNIRGGKISIIFQEPMTSLSPLHTIGDQVSEALFLHQNLGKKQGREQTIKMLKLVGFPDPERAMKSYAFELSGGLRQRAMIAMALVCQPAVLIADEPTTALDVTIQAQIIDLLKTLQNDLKMAIVLITHDLGVVANIADDIVVMYHGRVVESGPARILLNKPKHPYLQCLLKAIPRFAMAKDEKLHAIREIDNAIGDHIRHSYEDKDVRHLINQQQDETTPGLTSRPKNEAEPYDNRVILRIRDLSKTYVVQNKNSLFSQGEKIIKAVSDFNLDIYRGESFGLVGESGCGKSTLSKMLMRAVTPDKGSIEFAHCEKNGNIKWVDVLGLRDEDLMPFRKRVQYIFQDPFSSLNPRMTIFDILREPLLVHRTGNRKKHVEVVKELMNMVGLDTRFVNRYPHSFSGGQRQRISIARALALCPDILICDEPVSALDVSVQAQILNLFNDLREKLGLTYLFISHNLAVVDYVSDRVGVMAYGRLMEIADKTTIFKDPQHPYTQLLLSSVPTIDMDTPIPFQKIRDGKTECPSHWPLPFKVDERDASERGNDPVIVPNLVEVGDKHWVRKAV